MIRRSWPAAARGSHRQRSATGTQVLLTSSRRLYRALRDGRYLVKLDDIGLPVRDRAHARGIKRGHIWTFLEDRRPPSRAGTGQVYLDEGIPSRACADPRTVSGSRVVRNAN